MRLTTESPRIIKSKSATSLVTLPLIEPTNSNKKTLSEPNIDRTPRRVKLDSIRTPHSISSERVASDRIETVGSSRGNLTIYQRRAFQKEQVSQIMNFRRRLK